MTKIDWAIMGYRRFESGVDRGVLYLPDGRSAAWQGLTSIEEQTSGESKSYYMDGVKYLERNDPGDFAATLNAFTYPDEFNEVNGLNEAAPGFYLHDQGVGTFSLCYRTLIGDDVLGLALGYRLHILYNVIAKPSASSFKTLGSDVAPSEFSWVLSAIPVQGPHRPVSHVSIESTKTTPAKMAALETILYGTASVNPRLPLPPELVTLFST